MHRHDKNSKEGKLAGQDLAGGFSGCLLQLCGDLDYYAKWLQVPRWSTHSKPCGLCKATFKGVMSWMDNRPTAKWISGGVTTANWREHWNTSCALFRIPGVSAWSVSMDYTHCMFLGWLQYLCGSIMYMLVYTLMPDEPLANLHEIGEFIKQFQRAHPTSHIYKQRLDKLSMSHKKKGHPKLRG